jgi:hypothetical protein
MEMVDQTLASQRALFSTRLVWQGELDVVVSFGS